MLERPSFTTRSKSSSYISICYWCHNVNVPIGRHDTHFCCCHCHHEWGIEPIHDGNGNDIKIMKIMPLLSQCEWVLRLVNTVTTTTESIFFHHSVSLWDEFCTQLQWQQQWKKWVSLQQIVVFILWLQRKTKLIGVACFFIGVWMSLYLKKRSDEKTIGSFLSKISGMMAKKLIQDHLR